MSVTAKDKPKQRDESLRLAPSRSHWQIAWARLRRDRLSLIAMAGFGFICLVALVGPWLGEMIWNADPARQNMLRNFEPPSWTHPLGTDDFGRDVLTRLVWGARVSIGVAFAVAAISMTIGIVLGLIAGFYGGIVDDAINALIQTMLNIPLLFLVILLSVVFRPSPLGLAVIFGVTGWMGTARQVRGVTLSLREREFVLAARAMGASDRRIMATHILPNLMSLVLVIAGFDIAVAILAESGLSFLGLGIQPPLPSWGNMLSNSLEYIRRAWWLVAAPGMMIFITVLCVFLLTDGLRDALDPSLGNR
jgi:peptide/nickel transport system permease protein